VSRINKPNTWLHIQQRDVNLLLGNPEPAPRMSAVGGEADIPDPLADVG